MSVSLVKEVTALELWSILSTNPNSVLVDVRTKEEWQSSGTPDLSSIGKAALFLEWQVMSNIVFDNNKPGALQFVRMVDEKSFAADFVAMVQDKKTVVSFICRSGSRSRDAAALIASLGYEHSYSVVDGFEGGFDSWQFQNLPWSY